MTTYSVQLQGRETIASETMAFHFRKPAGFQFKAGQTAESLGLQGDEVYDLNGLPNILKTFAPGALIDVTAKKPNGAATTFQAHVRIDTPQEVNYYQHGGILHYVLRQLASSSKAA